MTFHAAVVKSARIVDLLTWKKMIGFSLKGKEGIIDDESWLRFCIGTEHIEVITCINVDRCDCHDRE